MTESDRTERRLLDSIRKAKTGSGSAADTGAAGTGSAGTGSAGAPQEPPARPSDRAPSQPPAESPASRPRVAKSRVAKPPAPDTGGTRSAANTQQRTKTVASRAAGRSASLPAPEPAKAADTDAVADRYRRGTRVWPD
jgi:hypothetical protein